MRKEVLLAVIAGAFLGLIIAFGIWRANIAFRPPQNGISTTATPPPQSEFGITLAEPEHEDVITQSTVTISGITRPDSRVIISAEEDDYLVFADSSGSFEEEIELIGGVNEIVIFAFGEDGARAEEKLTLVYSSEFLKLIEK